MKAIFAGGEDKAYRRFCALRWPETHGRPVCPRCGCLEFYDLKVRRRFKCAACHHQFSATSGTMFASHKLSFVDLLGAICLFVNASKWLSAIQLSRDLDVQYKTGFVHAAAGKLRCAALLNSYNGDKFSVPGLNLERQLSWQHRP
ncbi:transposase [Acidisoma cellulosilytica]|uniref:Transposase n=1 Tax=Acidisoma cellulosilyticum TaxID=2802395 RepID=A0A963Z4I8_9PROT|nr:transposase [Acidisoma cellulosilyticum]